MRPVGLTGGHRRLITVHGAAGGGEDDFPGLGLGCGLEEVQGPQNIFLGIHYRIIHGDAHAHLGGMMHQHLGLPAANQVEGFRGFDIVREELRRRRHVFPAAAAEIIHHRYLMAAFHQGVGHM